MPEGAKSASEVDGGLVEGHSEEDMQDANVHATQPVGTTCEPHSMPISFGDYFEDEAYAHSVRVNGGEEVSSVMNIIATEPALIGDAEERVVKDFLLRLL